MILISFENGEISIYLGRRYFDIQAIVLYPGRKSRDDHIKPLETEPYPSL